MRSFFGSMLKTLQCVVTRVECAVQVQLRKAAVGRGRGVEVAALPQILEPGRLSSSVVEPVEDVILQAPILVKNKRATAVYRHLLIRSHRIGLANGRIEVLQLLSLK